MYWKLNIWLGVVLVLAERSFLVLVCSSERETIPSRWNPCSEIDMVSCNVIKMLKNPKSFAWSCCRANRRSYQMSESASHGRYIFRWVHNLNKNWVGLGQDWFEEHFWSQGIKRSRTLCLIFEVENLIFLNFKTTNWSKSRMSSITPRKIAFSRWPFLLDLKKLRPRSASPIYLAQGRLHVWNLGGLVGRPARGAQLVSEAESCVPRISDRIKS